MRVVVHFNAGGERCLCGTHRESGARYVGRETKILRVTCPVCAEKIKSDRWLGPRAIRAAHVEAGLRGADSVPPQFRDLLEKENPPERETPREFMRPAADGSRKRWPFRELSKEN